MGKKIGGAISAKSKKEGEKETRSKIKHWKRT